MRAPITDFDDAIEKIRQTNSLTVIHTFIIPDLQALQETTPRQKLLLSYLLSTNDLDRIRLACATYLGMAEEVATLQQWLLTKPIASDKEKAYEAFLKSVEE